MTIDKAKGTEKEGEIIQGGDAAVSTSSLSQAASMSSLRLQLIARPASNLAAHPQANITHIKIRCRIVPRVGISAVRLKLRLPTFADVVQPDLENVEATRAVFVSLLILDVFICILMLLLRLGTCRCITDQLIIAVFCLNYRKLCLCKLHQLFASEPANRRRRLYLMVEQVGNVSYASHFFHFSLLPCLSPLYLSHFH